MPLFIELLRVYVVTTKENLLLYLKEEQGKWFSGEMLSNKLAVSRAAVWKHIRKLKEEGYIIESSPGKGYLLSKVTDLLLPDEIREGLDTEVFGKKDIFHFRETDSTNIRAKDLAAGGAPEGTLVIAEKQTRGKGRRNRIWFSPEGEGIYASLILRPAIPPGEAPRITLMVAVAAVEALLSLTQLKVKIKWPNDILVNGKKMAGILSEVSTGMEKVDYIIAGIGINVNTREEHFSEDIKGKATSLLIETGKTFPRVDVIQAYLKWCENYYEVLRKSGFEPVIRRWKELADIIGQRIMVDVMGKMYFGQVQDVDNDGVLILKDNQGRFHRITSGDVLLDPN